MGKDKKNEKQTLVTQEDIVTDMDLSKLEEEDSHLTPLIQPHGLLLVLKEPELTILQVSNNTESFFGVEAESLLNKNLKLILPLAQITLLQERLKQTHNKIFYSFRFSQENQGVLKHFNGLIHRNNNILILEIEPIIPEPENSGIDYYDQVKTSLLKIKSATNFQETSQLVVQEVRSLTGFDRVMMYRFEPDGSGIVIAEEKPDDWESYYDLHFPTIDIPPLTRKILSETKFRLNVDINRKPIELIPPNYPLTNKPVDLSFAILRSVSPCFVEYGNNMGLVASMVMCLMDEQELWGLIVCHHSLPKYVAVETRKYCECLGQIMSLELVKIKKQEIYTYREKVKAIQSQIQEHLKQISYQENQDKTANSASCILPFLGEKSEQKQQEEGNFKSMSAILEANGKNILELVKASGGVICFDNDIVLIGETPTKTEVKELITWFLNNFTQEIFSISSLSKLYPAAKNFSDKASGLLVISIILNQTSYHLLWFRPEVIQTINWGGDPKPSVLVNPDGSMRLCPRNSFELWKETVRGKSLPWQDVEIEAAKELKNLLTLAALEFSQTALKRSAEQAKIATQSKSQFLAKMSHELRTPLNAILGFSQIMDREGSLSSEQKQYLKIINRSGEHLLSLINDVLEMSKIEAGKMTFHENQFELYQVIESIAEMLHIKASAKNLQLILEFAADLPKVVITDENKLRQILINILENAIKFTQEGWVKFRVFAGSEPTQVVFEISDTGPGIAENELPTIFEAFIQTESGRQSMQGSGLGLPISKQFINLLGGNINVSSKLGKGSVFTFDIQVRLAEVILPQRTRPTQQVIGLQPGHHTYRILLVEDVEENRLLLLKLFSPIGFEVRTANNGEEAIIMWKKWRPHLIWMDMLMPVMDGYEATKRIKAMPGGDQTIIIAITANAFSDAQIATLEAGCDDYIAKPYREEILFEKMAQHLNIEYCYRYQSPSFSDYSSTQYVLTPDSLKVMPLTWINQLHQASLTMDEALIAELIQQIPATEENLIQNLNNLVDNFRLDLLLNLTANNE